MAIHDFDLARWLMGSGVERVTAEGELLLSSQATPLVRGYASRQQG